MTNSMNYFFHKLPEALSDEDLSMYRLAAQSRDILEIVTDGLSETPAPDEIYSDMSQYDEFVTSGTDKMGRMSNLQELFESLNGTAETDTMPEEVNQLIDESVADASDKAVLDNAIADKAASDKTLSTAFPNSLGAILSDGQIEQLNEYVKGLLPDMQENDISLYSKDSSIVGVLNDIKNMLENTSADAMALRQLFGADEFKLLVKDTLQQQWLLKPDDFAKTPDKLSGLYEKIEQQVSKMEDIMKASGTQNTAAASLAENIRGNIEFMNQVNEAYTYVQVPLKMNGQNASGQLYVYTNKKNISDPDRELSAFLHLDLDHLGSTDVSVKMLHKKVTTNFYMDSDESYALVKQFMPVLERRLQEKGYNCDIVVNNGAKHINFVDDFLKKDMPPTGQVHRYSFDMRA